MSDFSDFETKLMQRAIEIRQRAYAPYSKFPVGAAILAENGHIFCACNVENCSYGLTVCAERNAVSAMIAAGNRRILAIAIAMIGNSLPCGACRQVLAEFGEDFSVLIINVDDPSSRTKLSFGEIFPSPFRLCQAKP